MKITDMLALGKKGLDLYKEGDKAFDELKTAIASSKEALSTKDIEGLTKLLREATARRRVASADLEAALNQPK